ncbi:MAG: 23S rRNA (uracil(1939)-C(5))-methyltransferase RlmD [Bacteroidota bacterium]
MARKKKIIKNVRLTGFADKGRSVGRDEEGRVCFVENTVPGDLVDVVVTKKRSGYLQGFPKIFHEYSPDRIDAFCEYFGICGGCKYQNLDYATQLKHKEQVVFDAVHRIGKVKPEAFLPILPSERTTFYRNKLEFTFSDKRWLTNEEIAAGASNQADVLGFHRPRAFDKIVDIQKCHLEEDPSNAIRNAARAIGIEQGLEFFDIRKNTGDLRNIVIRVMAVGEVMVIVVFYRDEAEKRKAYLDELLRRVPSITSLHYCINPKVNDFILDLDIHLHHGKAYVEETLGEVRYKIGPKSFFQTNTRQAIRLFDVVCDFAEFDGTENVYDLYTGIGSIALYIAQRVKQVVGVEEIAAAIDDAKINMAYNEIDNTVFYAGDVKDILSNEFAEKHGRPDLVITDPPRAGMHPKVVKILLDLAAPKVVYVSCNPATQARDLNLLSEKYDTLKVRAVDMFPHTHHIESVALLQLKGEFHKKALIQQNKET